MLVVIALLGSLPAVPAWLYFLLAPQHVLLGLENWVVNHFCHSQKFSFLFGQMMAFVTSSGLLQSISSLSALTHKSIAHCYTFVMCKGPTL